MIFYTVDLGAPATESAVNAAMTRTADAQNLTGTDPADFARSSVFLSSGMRVSAFTASPVPFLHPVKEVYDFDPAVGIRFRLNHGYDMSYQDLDMVRLVVAVLAATDGDAVLTFNGELAMLARIAGRLTVKTGSTLWNTDMIALLPPHETGDLPNM